MAEIFFPRLPSEYAVVDYDVINDTFSVIAREVQGQLNEHNFELDMITTVAQMEGDIYARTYSEATAYDPDIDYGAPNAVPVVAVGSWQVIRDYEGQSTGGFLWVMFSAQIDPGDDQMAYHPDGIQLAIRVNGAVIWESCTGSGDYDQDPIFIADVDIDAYPKRGMHTYGCSYKAAVVCEALVPVNNGRFVVEVLATVGTVPGSTRDCFIAGQELIIIDLVQ
jgi:hypothetical protein